MTMQKAKKYDWKDSNLALFGSDTEREVKTINFSPFAIALQSICLSFLLYTR